MRRKYSDTPSGPSGGASGDTTAATPTRIFAVDSGSPVSSVALAWDGQRLTREFPVGDSSVRLLPLLDDMLAEAGGRLDQLEGLIAARGPGSFTGLRIGLATLLGLHQALGTPATTATTFEALGRQARRRLPDSEAPIYAAIDALREERFVQEFDPAGLQPVGEARIRANSDIAQLANGTLIGFGLGPIHALRRGGGSEKEPERDLKLLEAEPLAADLMGLALEAECVWDDSGLTRPLYLRPPAAAVASRAADS